MTVPHVTNEDRWASIPEALLFDPSICADAVRVYGVLRRHGSDPSNCYPSHARIASLVGASSRSIPAWLRQLEAGGWIERVPRKTAAGDNDSNGYIVFGRAVQRGVRAGERAPSTPASAEGCAPASAPKESHQEREQEERDKDLSVEPVVALQSAAKVAEELLPRTRAALRDARGGPRERRDLA